MRKLYETPELEVVTLKLGDVLTPSQPISTEGAGGGGNLDNDDDWDLP